MDRISLSDFSGQVEAEAFRFQRSARGIERVSRTVPHGTERSRRRKRLRPMVPAYIGSELSTYARGHGAPRHCPPLRLLSFAMLEHCFEFFFKRPRRNSECAKSRPVV